MPVLQMKKIFTAALLCVVLFAQGQEAVGPEKPDKKTIKKVMDWVSIFTMYSNVDISDKVDLKEYGEAADLLKSFITNAELSVKIAEFKQATFLNVYPKGMLLGDEWILRKLNEVSDAQYNVLNAPYITTEAWFKPDAEATGYTVSLLFKTTDDRLRDYVTQVNATLNTTLTGSTFATPRDAKEKVNAALFEGLDKLKALVGITFAPKIAIRFNDELYLHNQTLEAWQKAAGSIDLVAVDKNDQPLIGSITWTNAIGTTNAARFPVNDVGLTRVTAKAGNDQISVLINVKEFSLNVQDLLKQILIEVVEDKLDEARKTINKIVSDSSSVNVQIRQTNQSLDLREGYTNLATVNSQLEVNQELLQDARQGTIQELQDLKKDELSNDFIEQHRKKFALIAQGLLQVKIEKFLNDIVNGGNMNVYVKAIEDESPQLIAELITNMIRTPENRTQIKDIVINFINKQIDEVVSKS